MDDLRAWIEQIWAVEMVRSGLRAALIVLAGLLVAHLLNRRMRGWSMHVQHRLMVRRVTTGVIVVVTAAWAMAELGLRLGVVLGAAGVLTVAVGFAAQTSFSNLISGIFLMAEQPFRVGDIINVADTTGEVMSIDLLAVKLRTFDNLQVRIPNETMLKANVTNVTRFPIRRHDFKIGVAYSEDLARVRELLLTVAANNHLCLRNPGPLFFFLDFAESSVDIQFSVWAKRERLFDMRTSMAIDIMRAFREHGIEIPFPQRTLQIGATASTYLDRLAQAPPGSGSQPAAEEPARALPEQDGPG